MDIDLNNIDFAIAVNTFHDDIQDKLQILNKMQMEFLRKFQHRVKISEHHSEMIFQIRKIVGNIEEMYKDIKDYFVQMKVDFVYDFVRKIQTLMVIGYNHLSQALLITFDMYQQQKTRQKQTKDTITCTCKTKNDYILSKDQFKRLQHIQYTISNIESEQQRLLMEMQTIYDRMMMQKGLIQKVKPSLASKQLQQMKDHIQTVMENNQRLFQETYMMKFFQFHNHIKSLDKPDKITEVYMQMNSNLKQSFVKQTLKAADRIERSRRLHHQNMIDGEAQTCQQPRTKSRRDANLPANQTSLMKQSSTSSSHFSLTKQRKLNQKLSIQMNHLQKQNLAITEELNSYKFAEKQIQIKYRELLQKFQIVEEMYKKSKQELQEIKTDADWTIGKLIVENKRIKQQIFVLKGRQYTGLDEFVNTQTQTDRIVKRNHINSRANSQNFNCVVDQVTMIEQQTQTYEQYLLPSNQNEIVKLLKNRNQKAIIMLNQKDKKIRQSSSKIINLEDQTIKIKSNLNMFVGIVEEHFNGKNNQASLNQNSMQASHNNLITQNKSAFRKKSVLQMNSYEIQQKIKHILKLIVLPKQQDYTAFPSMKTKFKKLTSIIEQNSPTHRKVNNSTLEDQQFQSDSVHELPNSHNTNLAMASKTFSEIKTQTAQQIKKKKRISVLNLLSAKRMNIHPMIDQQCQTIEAQSLTKTRQIETQTNMDDKILKNIPKYTERNQIQEKKQRHNYEKSLLTSRKVRNLPSNRNSETAMQNRQKKSSFSKNLNTFEKFKIQSLNRGSQSNQSRFRKIQTNLSQNTRKMLAASSLSNRNELTPNQHQVHSIFNDKQNQLSPFKIKQDPKLGRFSSLLDQSFEKDFQKLTSKYDEKQNNLTITFNNQMFKKNALMSSTLGSFKNSMGDLNFNKGKMKKYTHNRLVSQMASTFKPVSQVIQNDNQKDVINISYSPHNTFSSGLDALKNQKNAKLLLTSNSISKLKENQRSQQKKKTLLLSIQKYNTQNTSINEMMLQKYLSKVLQKWGKQKVKQVLTNLTSKHTLRPDNFPQFQAV